VISLKQMDRMDMMGTFALHDRFIHFHRLAGYWSAVYDALKPDVLLMPSSPHVTYDTLPTRWPGIAASGSSSSST